jgi:uncharacterized protein (DUF362 family)
MVKGVAVKMSSYEETIPKVLRLIKFDQELKKHEKIVLKPSLISGEPDLSTNPAFVEQVLKFCVENKNPGTEIFIAEGVDGEDSQEVFNERGFSNLSEKYGVSLVDLNNSETEDLENEKFLRFDSIKYPKILSESFIISLPVLFEHRELGLAASLDNMLGAFPAKHYKGFFSNSKNKIKKHDAKYQIHDIIQCKMPEFAIIDASEQGLLIAGQSFEMDKQAAKALGIDWQTVDHLKLLEETLSGREDGDLKVDDLIGKS